MFRPADLLLFGARTLIFIFWLLCVILLDLLGLFADHLADGRLDPRDLLVHLSAHLLDLLGDARVTIVDLLLELTDGLGRGLRIIDLIILVLIKLLHADDVVGEPSLLVGCPLPIKQDALSFDDHMKLSFVGLLLRIFHAGLVAGADNCDHKVGEDDVAHDHDDKPEDPSEGLVLRVRYQLIGIIVTKSSAQAHCEITYPVDALVVFWDFINYDGPSCGEGSDDDGEEQKEVANVLKDVGKHLHQETEAVEDPDEELDLNEAHKNDHTLEDLDHIKLILSGEGDHNIGRVDQEEEDVIVVPKLRKILN